MEKINFDINQFLQAISFAIDFVEIDILGASQNHSRRVAYISLRIAEELGLSEQDKSDIVAFSIMHDNGLCEESLHTEFDFRNLPQLRRMEGLKEHCIFGENNIKDYPLAGKNKNIVKYHHENWDGSGFFGLKEDEIPLLAQIIGLADFVDNVYHFEKERKKEIKDFIISNKGKRFSPQIAEAFLKVASHQKFWLDLKNEFIWIALKSHAVPNIKQLTWKEIFSITKVFVSIIDSKSRFTGRHSSGLIEKTKIACDFYNFDETTTQKMLIAASLHDLGKLAVSSDILEKPAKLNAAEINVMKAHTYYTKIALSQIEHFDEIKNWSANHHEKLNGNGYPEGLAADRLCFNSRLLACLDIFQALTENRPYRKGMKFEDAFAIMKKLAKQNDIDAEIVNGFIPQLKNIAF